MFIELKNIKFSYGNEQLFDNFSFSAKSGKITGLLGSSGCGKTTILRLIAGFELAEKGRVIVDGQVFSDGRKNFVPLQKRKTGFVFQDLALWSHKTVFGNIAFGLKAQKIQNYKEKVEEILDFTGLTEMSGKYPHQLSGGQKQLVAIARAVVLNPKILLMDEPLSNLDVKLKVKILDFIVNLKNKYDLTIIYVTHSHKEAFAIADEIAVMSYGKIEAQGTVEQIKHSANEYVRSFLEY